jgi:DNA processing protein
MSAAAETPGACLECLRRSWLVAQLGEHLERIRFGKRLGQVMALDDLAMIEELAEAEELEFRARHAGFDPAWLPTAEGVQRICRHDPRYPAALHRAADAPAVLSVTGALSLDDVMQGPNVALVGSRKPSDEGQYAAKLLARRLAGEGITVISALARGINNAVHQGALEGGGMTLSVMPCGVDVSYPVRKQAMREQLLRNGVLLSELPIGYRPRLWCFAARNRIVAGLATTTVVVEAGARDGQLTVAWIAQDLGRPVGAIAAGAEHDVGNEGILRLLEQGAVPLHSSDEVLALLSGELPNRPATFATVAEPQPGEAAASASSMPTRFGLQLPPTPPVPAAPPVGVTSAEDAGQDEEPGVDTPSTTATPLSTTATPLSTTATPHRPGTPPLDPELQTLLEAVRAGCGDVAALTGMDVTATLAGLAMLELLGQIQRGDDGRYQPVAPAAAALARFR